MKPEIPIFVPSKGRPNGGTFRLLKEGGLDFKIVVEPQDFDAYKQVHGSSCLVSLDENDQGIGYVRQALLDFDHGSIGWYWQLDDDLSAFYRREGKKMIKCPAGEALCGAEKIVSSQGWSNYSVGQLALEYQQFCWSATSSFKLNSYCDVAVANNARAIKAMGVAYDPGVNLKEDRDITIQCIVSGMDVVRCTTHAFGAPRNGSNEGGLSTEYGREGYEAQQAQKLADKWPHFVSVQTKPDGRFDAKINWRRIRQ